MLLEHSPIIHPLYSPQTSRLASISVTLSLPLCSFEWPMAQCDGGVGVLAVCVCVGGWLNVVQTQRAESSNLPQPQRQMLGLKVRRCVHTAQLRDKRRFLIDLVWNFSWIIWKMLNTEVQDQVPHRQMSFNCCCFSSIILLTYFGFNSIQKALFFLSSCTLTQELCVIAWFLLFASSFQQLYGNYVPSQPQSSKNIS